MLALFKDGSADAPQLPSALLWARAYWRQQLDKGIVPSFAQIQEQWLKEYPQSPERILPLLEWSQEMGESHWLLPLMDTVEVREIFAHGPELIEALGQTRQSVRFPLEAHDWCLWIETFAVKIQAEFNYSSPCSSTYWRHRDAAWRVTLLHPSLSSEQSAKIFLRRLAVTPHPLETYGLDDAGVSLLREAILSKTNVLVAGSTGSGKTSLMSALLQAQDPEDHLLILEDTQELSAHAPRLTRLLSADKPGRSLSELLAHSLRLSPDRIVVGEMRSHEVVPFLLAMNTGHRGVMSTLHASSAVDALHRVGQLFTLASNRKEMDYREVIQLVCKNVGLVVFLEHRKIKQVIRVFGSAEGQPLYDVVWAKAGA